MPTLAIETGIEPEYEQRLMESAWTAGWDVVEVRHIPFTTLFILAPNGEHGNPISDEFRDNTDVWLNGSIQAAKGAQAGTKWKVHAPWNELRCSRYYLKLADRLLQKDHTFATLAELPRAKDQLYATSGLAEDGTLFIRPDGNDKVFTGGCISLDDWDHGFKLMTFYEPPPETRVVVARPRRISAEARFLVVGGKLVTGSYYKTGGQSVRLEASDDLMAIADDFLAFCLERGFNPSPSWVLDLAETAEGWHIIEVGATSCCGLYQCDTDKFVTALTEVLPKEKGNE